MIERDKPGEPRSGDAQANGLTAAQLLDEIHEWRQCVAYWLGDMADTATPDECRVVQRRSEAAPRAEELRLREEVNRLRGEVAELRPAEATPVGVGACKAADTFICEWRDCPVHGDAATDAWIAGTSDDRETVGGIIEQRTSDASGKKWVGVVDDIVEYIAAVRRYERGRERDQT